MLAENVDLVADGAVAPGGFELVTPNTLVASDLEADFQNLADQMLQYLVGAPTGGSDGQSS